MPGHFLLQILIIATHALRIMRPVLGISCCVKSFGPTGLPNHAASDFAIRAAARFAGAVPVLMPALGQAADLDALLRVMDGVLLTGSRSNVNPAHYGGPPHEDGTPEDEARDATTLPLIRAAVARGVPVLAICRGVQELNVALGGTLHQKLQDLPGRLDHSAPETAALAEKIAKRHEVTLTSGGMLHRLAGARTVMVNSLHNQGIDRLGAGLVVEAVAPDGTIEAVRAVTAPGLALGVQWHPEFDCTEDGFSARIFEAFGEAMRTARGGGMVLAAY
jgi:putative glutamine amidotransferase